MKKIIALLVIIGMMLAAFACSEAEVPEAEISDPEISAAPQETTEEPIVEPAAESVELTIFAAASMTETLEEIAELYKNVAPHVTFVFNFDSSGVLLTQIKEGAHADLFISAAQKQMNELDINAGEDKNPNGLDMLLSDSRFNLVENEVVLIVPNGNPGNIQSFDDIANCASLAIGNSDVPVGQYSEEILTNMGIWNDALFGKTTFGSNVKEVTTWVAEGVVECGIVYATDAYSAGLTIVASAPADTLQTPVVYPAAVLNITQNEEAALAFLAFLQSSEASDIFRFVGFSIPALVS